VWFCTGLWHGASWNFVIWGLFLGFFVVMETLLKKYFDLLPRFILIIYALVIIHISRSIFFYDNIANLKIYLRQLFYSSYRVSDAFITDLTSNCFLYLIVFLFCIPWNEIFSSESRIYGFFDNIYRRLSLPINLILLFLCSVLLVDAAYNPFIYFRF
jgi:alginate O-acetyltransferase complex protein AlgI